MNFQETLEAARYEVSIELYPNGAHYQIYKPDCPDAHCWEVYRSPRTAYEDDVNLDCDSLDEAIAVMAAHAERCKKLETEYVPAMDTICGECLYATEANCEQCAVRKTYDIIRSR